MSELYFWPMFSCHTQTHAPANPLGTNMSAMIAMLLTHKWNITVPIIPLTGGIEFSAEFSMQSSQKLTQLLVGGFEGGRSSPPTVTRKFWDTHARIALARMQRGVLKQISISKKLEEQKWDKQNNKHK